MPHAEISYLSPQRITLISQWNESELIKSVPGARWNSDHNVWTVPLTWPTCQFLRGVFGGDLTLGPTLIAWGLEILNTVIDPALRLRNMLRPEGDVELDGLYPFQFVDVQFIDLAGNVLIGNDMGTGKTVSLLRALRHTPALVICPNSVRTSWAEHVRTWREDLVSINITGSATARRRQLLNVPPNAVVIMNIESVRLMSRLAPYGSVSLRKCRECDRKFGEAMLTSARCETHVKELNRIPFQTVILDEAHRIKDPSSKQTRAVWHVAHMQSVRQRIAATGTPIANGPEDLWSVLHFLDPKAWPTRVGFIDRYALMSWNSYGGMSVQGLHPAVRDEFYRCLDPIFRRVPKEAVLAQLPPKVYTTHVVTMTPKQAKAYREISAGFITRVDTGILVAKNDLVAQTRLTQLASSYCDVKALPGEFDEFGRPKYKVTMSDPCPKIDELVKIIDDLPDDQQIAVSAESRQLIMMARDRLSAQGISVVTFVGGLTDVERNDIIERFQSGRARVILFTLKAGGIGITLTAASTLVRLQRSWSLVDNLQGEDRVHRIGSERHAVINIIDIVSEGTVEDEVQLPRLREKLRRLDEIRHERMTRITSSQDVSTHDLDIEERAILATNLGVPSE